MSELKPNQSYQERLSRALREADHFDGDNFRWGIILLSGLIVVLLIIFGTYILRSRQKNDFTVSSYGSGNQVGLVDRLFNNESNIKTISQDADQDGLSNSEEAEIKTDPLKADTDNDGLTDREEIKVYKTDPLKADTDSDGMDDGLEIKNYRDPLDSNPSAVWPPRP